MAAKQSAVKPTTSPASVELGDKVRDRVTGHTGIATQRVECLNGCIQFTVRPRIKEDGTWPDPGGIARIGAGSGFSGRVPGSVKARYSDQVGVRVIKVECGASTDC
jgi:hypothetical protein